MSGPPKVIVAKLQLFEGFVSFKPWTISKTSG